MFEVDTLCAAWYAIVFKFIFYLLLVAACSIIWSLYFVRRSPHPLPQSSLCLLWIWTKGNFALLRLQQFNDYEERCVNVYSKQHHHHSSQLHHHYHNRVSLLQWRFAIIMDLQQSWVKAVHSSRLNHGHIFMFPVHWCLCCSL